VAQGVDISQLKRPKRILRFKHFSQIQGQANNSEFKHSSLQETFARSALCLSLL
jgi:hypothetical protein